MFGTHLTWFDLLILTTGFYWYFPHDPSTMSYREMMLYTLGPNFNEHNVVLVDEDWKAKMMMFTSGVPWVAGWGEGVTEEELLDALDPRKRSSFSEQKASPKDFTFFMPTNLETFDANPTCAPEGFPQVTLQSGH